LIAQTAQIARRSISIDFGWLDDPDDEDGLSASLECRGRGQKSRMPSNTSMEKNEAKGDTLQKRLESAFETTGWSR